MLRFVSLDLETSGTKASEHQILEFGAAFEDYSNIKPVSLIPKFHSYVKWDTIHGSPYALWLNARCIAKIVGKEPLGPGEQLLTPTELCARFYGWLEDYIRPEGQDKIWFTVAGKNAATFDLKFLDRWDAWRHRFGVSGRVIDVGTAMLDPFVDEQVPDSQTCYDRCGLEQVRHHALDDALSVIRMLRRKYLNHDHWE